MDTEFDTTKWRSARMRLIGKYEEIENEAQNLREAYTGLNRLSNSRTADRSALMIDKLDVNGIKKLLEDIYAYDDQMMRVRKLEANFTGLVLELLAYATRIISITLDQEHKYDATVSRALRKLKDIIDDLGPHYSCPQALPMLLHIRFVLEDRTGTCNLSLMRSRINALMRVVR